MAEAKLKPTEETYWGISYLREDLQDVKHDIRDFRLEMVERFKEVYIQFSRIDKRFGSFLRSFYNCYRYKWNIINRRKS